MACIERTAYPRFKSNPTAQDLHTLYTPTHEEIAWAQKAARPLIALDLPGHGRSGGAAPATIYAFANYLAAFLDVLRVRLPIVLLGHSLGGLISLSFVASHPALATGLVPPPEPAEIPPMQCCTGLRTVPKHAVAPKTIDSPSELLDTAKTSAECSQRPDRALTKPRLPETTSDRELDRLMAAWPRLPEYVRRAFLILADDCQ
jgi:pimeloyl-ACP methyl ester carboxylesterase